MNIWKSSCAAQLLFIREVTQYFLHIQAFMKQILTCASFYKFSMMQLWNFFFFFLIILNSCSQVNFKNNGICVFGEEFLLPGFQQYWF